MLQVLQVLQVRQVRQVLRVLQVLLLIFIAAVAASAESRTIVGEVVDVRCYEKAAANSGAAHVDCALSCARRGAALGILTTDGVFVISGEYATEANKRLIEFVARTVKATGEVTEREGRRTIRIRAIQLVTRNP